MTRFTTSCLMLSLVAVVLMSGCAMTMTPVTGFAYSDVKGPWVATSADGGSKVGTSEAQSILGLVGLGDASIEADPSRGLPRLQHSVDLCEVDRHGLRRISRRSLPARTGRHNTASRCEPCAMGEGVGAAIIWSRLEAWY